MRLQIIAAGRIRKSKAYMNSYILVKETKTQQQGIQIKNGRQGKLSSSYSIFPLFLLSFILPAQVESAKSNTKSQNPTSHKRQKNSAKIRESYTLGLNGRSKTSPASRPSASCLLLHLPSRLPLSRALTLVHIKHRVTRDQNIHKCIMSNQPASSSSLLPVCLACGTKFKVGEQQIDHALLYRQLNYRHAVPSRTMVGCTSTRFAKEDKQNREEVKRSSSHSMSSQVIISCSKTLA